MPAVTELASDFTPIAQAMDGRRSGSQCITILGMQQQTATCESTHAVKCVNTAADHQCEHALISCKSDTTVLKGIIFGLDNGLPVDNGSGLEGASNAPTGDVLQGFQVAFGVSNVHHGRPHDVDTASM